MNIFGTEFDYAKRLDTLRTVMEDQQLDAIIVHNWTNQYYYGGHYQHMPWYPLSHTHITEAPLLLFKDSDPVFMAAFITMNAIREGTWIKDVRVNDTGYASSPADGVAKVLAERGLSNGNIGYEETTCTAVTLKRLTEALPGATLKPAGDLLFIARSVKDEAEIALIRKAVEIGHSAIDVAIKAAQPGVTEMEVQFAMEIEMKRLGAMREVETMCQSGIRTANYRAFAAEWKEIEVGDLVTIDLGGLYHGYGFDIARTWCIGQPKDEYVKIAQDCYDTHDEFMRTLKAGMSFADIFDHIRAFMIDRGYPANKAKFPCQQFAIHGVGLGPFHDFPHPTHRETIIQPNMVLSFQPSVRTDTFSFRFENNILVKEDGLELLSTTPHKLI
ncbi:aminopeptidase P family protein (plasmid) [Paracoccus methylovorus]|uniref:Aminopeptidase P family protein n=1 Tax=Paracoccus methylovorus TaxID=2812658 RepID=A0ABX7JSC3_9RHOB|nr:Xaa-Pro peptidase family protein [Paracoccus methylovorus]QRZ16143.1 aminopeptidase P family protein [Paracoccus methylovorus]